MRSILIGGLALALLLSATRTGAQTPPISPTEGFWYDAARPGNGFSLEVRERTVALAFYHFDAGTGRSRWHLAVGELEGNTLTAALQPFEGGSCLGCLPFAPAEAQELAGEVRLTFVSLREATLQVGDGAPRHVVAMPYGVDYVETAAAPPGILLPDLRGRWLIGSPEDRSLQVDVIFDARIDAAAGEPGGVTFTGIGDDFGAAPFRAECTESAPDNTICRILIDRTDSGTEVLGEFAVGDIDEERMLGLRGTQADEEREPLVAWRVADAEGQP